MEPSTPQNEFEATLARLASAQEDMASQLPRVLRQLDRISAAVSSPEPGPRLSRFKAEDGQLQTAATVRNSRNSQMGLVPEEDDPPKWRSSRASLTSQEHLPDSWPWSITMRTDWEYSNRAKSDMSKLSKNFKRSQSNFGLEEATPKSFSRGVIDPRARVYLVYKCCCLLLIAHDSVSVPYMLAWGIEISGKVLVAAWCMAFWWFLDLVLNFTTAYHLNGTLVWNRSAIRAHYLKTWFVPDLALVVIDFATLGVIVLTHVMTSSGNASPVGVGIVGRAARILRMASMCRMMKTSKLLADYAERRAMAENWQLFTNIASVVMSTIFVTHWAACGWVIVGWLPSDTGRRWMGTVAGLAAHEGLEAAVVDFEGQGFSFQYFTAFHFAVAQLTLGATEMQCTNTWERLYVCVLLVLGLLLGCSLVSGLSAVMVQSQLGQKERNVQLRTLQQFMRYHKVRQSVARRVEQQAIARLRKTRRVEYESVNVLKELSVTLLTELRFHICQPVITSHGLLRVVLGLNQQLVERLCSEAISILAVTSQDNLFLAGVEATATYMIVDGTVSYTQTPEHSSVEDDTVLRARAGTWFAEAALWAHWVHVGVATAVNEGTVFVLSVERMTATMAVDGRLMDITSGYCREYHRRLTSEDFSDGRPSDMSVSLTSFDDIVTSLDEEQQITIYQGALDQAAQADGKLSFWQHRLRLPRLQQEVDERRSAVLIDAEGNPYRIVRSAVAFITLPDGRALYELGRVDKTALGNNNDGQRVVALLSKRKSVRAPPIARLHSRGSAPYTRSALTAGCRLPTVESRFAETPWATWTRMLSESLKSLADSIQFDSHELQKEWETSPELGVRTLYSRVVYHAVVTDHPDDHGQFGEQPTRKSELSSCSWDADLMDDRANTAVTAVATAVARNQVIVIKEDPAVEVFYCWLTMAEADELQAPGGETPLRKILDRLVTWRARRAATMSESDQAVSGFSISAVVQPPPRLSSISAASKDSS